ncbi:MAG: NADH oxidase [Deltaproteobacteria bacterium]|nr:NADH oxidase [Deltaproteobacteria bacterium]
MKALHTTITSAGELVLELRDIELPAPKGNQVVIKLEAAPINPSDLILVTGPADLTTARRDGDRLVANVPKERLAYVAGRLDQAMPAGNEGAGTVVDAGPEARDLIGKRVAVASGGTYAEYKLALGIECLVLPDGATAADGAAATINPLTALAMPEVMRREGHAALVHTAAASNLGQMLVKICKADRVPLVNIVRKVEHVALLRDLGATHVVDSSTPSFRTDLIAAIAETGATLAFDAIGGGSLASTILTCMEVVAARGKPWNRYGTNVHKQVYIYGRLDMSPTILDGSFGLAYGVDGFLVSTFMAKAGMETVQRMRTRIRAELTTTFASHFGKTIGLADILDPAVLRDVSQRATGAKALVEPNR